MSEESGETLVVDSLRRLARYCVAERYRGYSLYDSHTSPLPLHRLGRWGSFLTNQVVKRSPINLRPLLRVEKGINPKGVGLFLHAQSELLREEHPPRIALLSKSMEAECEAHVDWLLANHSGAAYGGLCWGYNYPWPKRDVGLVPAYTPSSVVTGFNARALFSYHGVRPSDRVADALRSAARFIVQDIPRIQDHRGSCFSYTPLKRDQTVNANLLAAEVLAYADSVSGEARHIDVLREVLRFTVNTQNEDGSWWYSFNMRGGAPKRQIDFHQGYVLESIARLCAWSRLDFEPYREVVERGLAFYCARQFDENGDALWRYPSRWPVDIHNQSQGIITFSRFAFLDPEHLAFARRIAHRTIRTMQGPDGRFYYQRWPALTNKVSYMRWNQAWMYLALVTLLRESRRVPDARPPASHGE